MGATKELLQEIEVEQINPELVVETEEPSEYINLLNKLRNKDVRLSYSSLKAFAVSPRNFIKYKLKERTPPSESQMFGSLCDCLLTEPDRFEELFVIIKSVPTSENQKGFCNDMISGKSKDDAYANNYKTGGVDKVYSSVGDYVEAILSGKTVCTQKMYDEAFAIVENLKKSELVMGYIDACTGFQCKTEWKHNGWNFLGYKDAEGHNLIIDFKYSKDANPDKFERDIMNYKYYMQMGMYSESVEGLPECYFIVYDKSLNFSLIKLDYSILDYGRREYKYLVTKLEQCIKENRFSESYNFFDVQQRTVYKPKWVKGFETETD